MKISDLLNEKTTIPHLSGKTKLEAINEMIDIFREDPRVTDLEKVRETVLAREKIMSTGVGKGFAIPHGKTDAIDDILVAFARADEPIEYEALDQQPVNLIFLIVGKENMVGLHIKLLSRISRMMTKDEFRDKLIAAGSTEEILAAFKEEESTYFDL